MISRFVPLIILAVGCVLAFAEGPAPIELWPGAVPGEKAQLDPEKDMSKPNDGKVSGKPVIRLGNVSKPTITVYRAPADKNTGTAVLVSPGGGYNILAMDLEGTEICEWLNSIGVNAVLLKYRVPKRQGLEKQIAPLQDAQRAIRLMRKNADEWSFKKIGALGFSAGGHLAATLCNTDESDYPRVDEADKFSCRPDFNVLIYPAYLTVKEENDKVAPELKISSKTPQTFITMAQDDPVRVESALMYAVALQKAKIPLELHIYPQGGHGYGLRPSENTISSWPKRVEEWMKSRGLLDQHGANK